jgi:uncharacterized protein (TIGR02594 family)
METVSHMEQMRWPPWLKTAARELGVAEVEGAGNNPRILEYLATVLQTRLSRYLRDETPWCSAFVNWCFKQVGAPGTDKPNARSWVDWGLNIGCPQIGAVCVLRRGKLPWQGHVGFVVGYGKDFVDILGGNQGNAVSVRRYALNRVLACRMPVWWSA